MMNKVGIGYFVGKENAISSLLRVCMCHTHPHKQREVMNVCVWIPVYFKKIVLWLIRVILNMEQ